jgi:hypothetical protein
MVASLGIGSPCFANVSRYPASASSAYFTASSYLGRDISVRRLTCGRPGAACGTPGETLGQVLFQHAPIAMLTSTTAGKASFKRAAPA